jgi:poly(A) polymerase
VRDVLMQRAIKDLDFALFAKDMGLAEKFARRTGGAFIHLDKAGRTVRVVVEGISYDFSMIQGEDIEADLKQRDFTINALAVSLGGEEPWDKLHVVDVSEGMNDLAKGLVRFVSAKSLSDDPLRMLRAYRLAAVLNFRVEEASSENISTFARLIQYSAVERIVEELDQLLKTSQAHLAIFELERLHLLDAIFPELSSLRGIDQYGYHHLDVFRHTLETLRFMELFILDPEQPFPGHAEELNIYLKACNPVWLKWCALFHDLGKNRTKKIKENGRISFPGHAHESAVQFRKAALRLKLSRNRTDLTAMLIELHLRPLLMAKAMIEGHLTSRGIARLVRRVRDDLPGLFLLAAADNAAKQGVLSSKDRDSELNRLFGLMLEMQHKMHDNEMLKRPILTGKDLIAQLGLTPGPLVGKLLRQINEANLAGEIDNRDEALFLAQELLDRTKPKERKVN